MLIYKLTNRINGKCYAGETTQTLDQRMNYYRKEVKAHKDGRIISNRPIIRALAKYGWKSFTVEIIDTASNIDELHHKERFWIKKLCSQDRRFGYNIEAGGPLGGAGIKRTLQTRKNMGIAKRKQKKWQGRDNPKFKFEPAIKANIVELYLQGKTTKEISVICSVSTPTIRRAINAAGINMPNCKTKLSEEDRFSVVDEYLQGKETGELALDYGVKTETIVTILDDDEIPLRKQTGYKLYKGKKIRSTK